jgi:MFS family permease
MAHGVRDDRRSQDRPGDDASLSLRHELTSGTPFGRLARAHMLSVAGDALLAIALADSLFFNVDPNDARWRVGAYLLLTLAPFAIVGPFLGPVMDRVRGGHRYMIIATTVIRAVLMAALVRYVQAWPLFPLAFSMLVMGKTYSIAKSAVVPTTVSGHEQLVWVNSRLAILSAVAGAVAGGPGILLLQLGGARYALALGVVIFVLATLAAAMIPKTTVAEEPADQAEKEELRAADVVLAASAMGFLRGTSGFVTMLLAFALRGGVDPGPISVGVELGHRVRESLGHPRLDLTTGGAPPWHFGVALIGVGIGGFIGSVGVPRLRSLIPEERILAYALLALTAMASLAAIAVGLAGSFLLASGLALSLQTGKQAFDSLVQREAPQANLGRSFSRFESRFQLTWVVGALMPVVVPIPARAGYVAVAVAAGFVAITYWLGRQPNPARMFREGLDRRDQLRRPTRPTADETSSETTAAAEAVDDRSRPRASQDDTQFFDDGPPPPPA